MIANQADSSHEAPHDALFNRCFAKSRLSLVARMMAGKKLQMMPITRLKPFAAFHTLSVQSVIPKGNEERQQKPEVAFWNHFFLDRLQVTLQEVMQQPSIVHDKLVIEQTC